MMLSVVIVCAATLLALDPIAVLMVRSPAATRVIYAASMVTTAISLAAAMIHLLAVRTPEAVAFPVGVPWLGAHLRLDALSAFFVAVVDLGAMSASLFALGYGEHEETPARMLPFYPVFLAGMTLVVLGDAFTLHDLKRLLAYHTVENIGIIFIGLGLALAFKSEGMLFAAALAFTAALLHVFNHSLFKSLLFFGAGAVLTATGERDMERLGGLIHRMPQTAFVFLIGCVRNTRLIGLSCDTRSKMGSRSWRLRF